MYFYLGVFVNWSIIEKEKNYINVIRLVKTSVLVFKFSTQNIDD